MRPGVVLLLLSALTLIAFSQNLPEKNVLVLLDTLTAQQSYSIFFKTLKERGYKLSFSAADDPNLSLSEHGRYLYDHVILFAPSADEFGGVVDTDAFVEFVDSGRNILLAVDSSASDPIREIASECGVQLDEEGTSIIDHFHSTNVGEHTALSVEPSTHSLVNSSVVVGAVSGYQRKPFLFKGIGQTINEDSGLNFAVLRGYDSTYSSKPDVAVKKDHSGGIGSDTILISALQARNNARVLVSGSLLFFSDRFFTQSSGNQKLSEELSRWVFNEKGILRASNITHHRYGETVAPQFYTINDTITYSVTIEEWDGKKWSPYITNDVQLEFTMLDPYVRLFLKPDAKGLYSVTFVAPDVYGVFSFKLNYHRLGHSSLSLKTIQSVIPFRHDEYPRFIQTANPYYLSSLSMVIGVGVLTVFLLFTK